MSISNPEYLRQNAIGFEGDMYLKKEVENLVNKFKINVIIETGAYLGNTTRRFSKMADRVISTEISHEYYLKALKNLAELSNVELIFSDTLTVLPSILKRDSLKGKNILFYLDDHWLERLPLLDELKIIAQSGIKPVIIIHDFKVPNSNLGYDVYNGQALSYEWIEASLKKIYPEFRYHYNSKADGARRGVIFVYPVI